MRIAGVGRVVFAAVMIALGIQGLVTGRLTAVWWPIPKTVPAREALVYLCAVVSLASGAGLLLSRTAGFAARLLLVYLLLWTAAFTVRPIVHAPTALLAWYGCAEIAVMIAGAWVLYAEYAPEWDRRHLDLATGERGVRIARVLYGLPMIEFGLAHFCYLQNTVVLIPRWIPGHTAWAYFTGATFLAAGAGVLTGVAGRLAATLAALQIGLFTLIVWVPIVAAGSRDPGQWMEFATSVALTAGGWVVADSYRGEAWWGPRRVARRVVPDAGPARS